MGVNKGSGTFASVIHGNNSNPTDGTTEAGKLHLTKTGSGTQNLSGTNTSLTAAAAQALRTGWKSVIRR